MNFVGRLLLLSLLVLVMGAAPQSTAPVASAPVKERTLHFAKEASPSLKAALLDVLHDENLAAADVGFLVVDLDRDIVLAETGADTLINPASNAKLLTSAAALHLLKPEYRWKTEYYIAGSLVNGVLRGDLVVKGGGDPTVVTERLQAVANELHLLGIRRITGSVVTDNSMFDNDHEPKGWELEEHPDRSYAAPTNALSLNFNSVDVFLRPTQRGRPAFAAIDPPVPYVSLSGTVTTAGRTRWLSVGSKPKGLTTVMEIRGALSRRAFPRRIHRRVYHPDRYFASALITFLRQRGVKVSHRIKAGTVPAGASLIHVDESPPLSKVIADLNHYSNNFMAETIVKTIAYEANPELPASFDAGLATIRKFLTDDVGFEKGTYVYNNGSGLNDVNRLTARQVVQLLAFMSKDPEAGAEFVSSLAVAGTRGTIRTRMRDGAAERRLRAKTGTLRGVSALSGYVADPDNRTLAFSILMQGYSHPVHVVDIWDVQNQIGEALASQGTSWEKQIRNSGEVAQVQPKP